MNWSPEQSAIFTFFATGTGNLIVKARAGTGKTTTIKAAFEHAPEARILYAVFNKKNQREAAEKIQDPRVDVKTLHSLGFAFIKANWRNAKPDDEVETDRAINICGTGIENAEFVSATCRLVGFAKNTCINATEAQLLAIIEAEDISCGDVSDRELCGAALKVLAASKIQDTQGRISFGDMVWLPCAMNWVKPWYNMVTIDEAQDMNLPQLQMARQASKGRVIVVGDDRQAIYGFRGAVQDGMGMMKVTLRAKELGLTTTYRCPKTVVAIAAELVPDYKAADSAPEGIVGNASNNVADEVKIGDAILSRLNAPLMPLALQLIRKNISARIEGRDIGKQLIGMVWTMKAKSVPHFIERVEAWLAKQIERLEKSKNATKKIEQARDIAETLKALAQDSKSVADIEFRINNLFQDTDANSKPAVILSSVHKAKGLEWPRIFILADTFRKGKGQEEDNIYYVAVTRAMKALYFVGGNRKDETPVRPSEVVKPTSSVFPAMIPSPGIQSEIATLLPCIIPPRFDSSRVHEAKTLFDNTEVLPGSRKRIEGEVIRQSGKIYVVTKVTASGATMDCRGERQHISSQCDASEPIEKMSDEDFVNRKSGVGDTNKTGNEGNNSMKNGTAVKVPKPKATTKGGRRSYAGRGDYIAKLVADGKTDKQIMEAVDASHYHGSSPSDVLACIAAKRAKKSKPAAAAKPASKKTPAKPAKKSNKPAKGKGAGKKSAEPTPAASAEAAPVSGSAIPPRPTQV